MIEKIKKHFKKIAIAILGIFTLTAAASTVLHVPQGGTGAGTFTAGGILQGDGTGAIQSNIMSGDGVLSSSGVLTVSADAVETITVEGKATETIAMGKAVYISGAVGNNVQFSLADNTVDSKTNVAGVAIESKTAGQTIRVRHVGQLDNFDTSAWADGDDLYLSTAGSLINTVPTSGTTLHVAYVEYSHATLGDILLHVCGEKNIGAPASTDLFIRMGDSAGANKLGYRDYANNEVANIDSDGNMYFGGSVGIGIATPAQLFHMQGNGTAAQGWARFGLSSTEYTEIGHKGNNSAINAVGDGDLDFRHDSVTKMSLTDAGVLTATTFTGALSGNATTATALAANGANCAVGNYPLGVNASGAVESCTPIGGGGDITDVFDCSTGNCSTMTVGTSEYLTYGTGYIDANRFAGVTTVDSTEFGYLNGLTAAIVQIGSASHDGFSDFVANEHLDWTADLGATNIHAGNYTDTTANETITLSGDVSGSGTTAITTTIGADKILESHLKSVNAPTDEYFLTYESTTGDFEWQEGGAGGFSDPMTTRGDIIYKNSSNVTTRLGAGTVDQVLTSDGTDISWAAAAGGAGDVGGLYGINVETLSADKTLTVDSNKIYQYLDEGGANRIITLATAGASAGDRFIVRHNGLFYDTNYLQINQAAIILDKIYVGAIKEFIFDGTNWVSGENGSGEDDTKKESVVIGYSSNGSNRGTVIGYSAKGIGSGVAIGHSTDGGSFGVAIGNFADGGNKGVAIGSYTNTNFKKYSVALGYYSETERYSEIAHCIDGSTTQDYNMSSAGWAIQTANATPVEMFLGEESNRRFTINPESVVSFTIRIAARDNVANEVASYKIEGLIKRDGAGNTVLVWSNKTVQYEDDASWDVAVTADDTNEALIITVTGDGTNPVRFAGRIDEVETQF